MMRSETGEMVTAGGGEIPTNVPRSLTDQAVQRFGLTDDPTQAGDVLPDGRRKYTQHIRCELVGKHAERTAAELKGWTGELCVEGKLRYRFQEREDSLIVLVYNATKGSLYT
jgi:hypothetical protein